MKNHTKKEFYCEFYFKGDFYMRRNHFLDGFVANIQEVDMIVGTGNNKKELKRVLSEMDSLLRNQGSFYVEVDVSKFSLEKLIDVVELARIGVSSRNSFFSKIIHPLLVDSFDLTRDDKEVESFYNIVQLGAMDVKEKLLNSSESYVAEYLKWVQTNILSKYEKLKATDKKVGALLEKSSNTVEKVTTWIEPHQLQVSQMDLTYLLETAFNPLNVVLDPHLSVNPSPSFQRDFVWQVEQKQSFIDSILKKIPLGAFYINRNVNNLTLGEGYGKILWDGKQRLHAVMSFYQDEFPVFYEGQWLFYSEMKPAFNRAIMGIQVVTMISNYETLEEIIDAYVMINGKQIKHTDEDLKKATDTLKTIQKKVNSF